MLVNAGSLLRRNIVAEPRIEFIESHASRFVEADQE